ncbi:MAG: DegT/DnrJ/EryC1/StrS family aminotransferase [Candidatus Latescibacteria bacterium]|nr:DegT/DnrJ/EryC1/StrS family aminotransferase [Candidatus Latescibacterota bacterium]
MAHLAVNGGPAVRAHPFPSWPVFTDEDADAVRNVVLGGKWGSTAEGCVQTFERQFADYQDARHGICVTNGTTALVLALQAIDIRPGDEVIVPAYTFIATANAVLMCNAVPVFVDIDPDTYNLDPALIEKSINNRTRAIMPVHFAGLPADLDRISSIAIKHNLSVIEDSAQAHGARWKNSGVGAQGNLGTFSFQSSKNLNAGEGGIVLTNDDELAATTRSLVNCGRAQDGLGYSHYRLAGNHRLSELQGALLQSQFKRLEAQTKLRSENAEYLSTQLSRIDGIDPTIVPAAATRHARHLYVFRYKSDSFGGSSKSHFVEALKAEGIPASPGYSIPLYRQPVFTDHRFGAYGSAEASEIDYGALNLVETERACQDEAIWFGQSVLLGTKEDMDDIILAIAKIRERRSELSS